MFTKHCNDIFADITGADNTGSKLKTTIKKYWKSTDITYSLPYYFNTNDTIVMWIITFHKYESQYI